GRSCSPCFRATARAGPPGPQPSTTSAETQGQAREAGSAQAAEGVRGGMNTPPNDHDLLLQTVALLGGRRGGKLQANGTYKGLCPAHADRNPSLDVGVAPPGHKNRLTFHCSARCKVPDIRDAAISRGVPEEAFARQNVHDPNRSTPKGPSRETRYPYHDKHGRLLYTQLRIDYADGTKKLWTEYPNGKTSERSLYRREEVLHREPANRWVLIPEGEKCVDRLRKEGFVATTNSHGIIKSDAEANRWRPIFREHLAGARVAILPDNDPPGHDHAEHVAQLVKGVASTVKVLSLPALPEKGDVFDWLEAGHTGAELRELIEAGPDW